jgi:hypothetical protein
LLCWSPLKGLPESIRDRLFLGAGGYSATLQFGDNNSSQLIVTDATITVVALQR